MRACLIVTLCPSLCRSSTHYGPVCAAREELCVADKSQRTPGSGGVTCVKGAQRGEK